jgi:hypothetical protein
MTPELARKLKELDLSPAQSTTRLRYQLKAILKKEHPDGTGGQFLTTSQETRYLAANEVLGLLDALPKPGSGKALQLLAEAQGTLAQAQSSILTIIEEERRDAADARQQQAVDSAQLKASDAIDRSIHQRYAPVRFGGWGLAAVAAAIAILDKPLGGIFDAILAPSRIWMAKAALGCLSLLGLIFGFIAKRRETKTAAFVKRIMTDAGIAYLFYRYDYLIF